MENYRAMKSQAERNHPFAYARAITHLTAKGAEGLPLVSQNETERLAAINPSEATDADCFLESRTSPHRSWDVQMVSGRSKSPPTRQRGLIFNGRGMRRTGLSSYNSGQLPAILEESMVRLPPSDRPGTSQANELRAVPPATESLCVAGT